MAPQPGWYSDGSTPGTVRWFDGQSWTHYTQPLGPPAAPAVQASPYVAQPSPYPASFPGPAYPGAAGYGAAAPAPDRNGPSSAAHWLLPVGRSWQSIVAGYVAILAMFAWPVGPIALGLGIWALVRAQHGGHGRGRAVFAVAVGVLATVGTVWAVTVGPFSV